MSEEMESMQQALQRAAFGLESPRLANAGDRELGPTVIEVRDIQKAFRIPGRRDRLEVLRGVSFEVLEGEFFGVVGRNGSGKSTLLKLLASIYRADGGSVRIGGRLAPFIELGVGFNPELTARENVALNGVMMGLGRREAASRLGAVLEFAELEEFVDLKLKNYSSGMLVRLAFAVMVEADADVMLVDEVLAVGDAAFAQKCMDVFRAKREAGRTVVLVTHDMATVQGFCDRALLLHDGEVAYLGDPEEAALRYYRLNFGGDDDGDDPDAADARVAEAWLEDAHGRRTEQVHPGQAVTFHATIEARTDLPAPMLVFRFLNVDGAPVFGLTESVEGGEQGVLAGERIRVSARFQNPLLPSRYYVECSIARSDAAGDVAMRPRRVMEFLVMGTDPVPGMVAVSTDLEAEIVAPQ